MSIFASLDVGASGLQAQTQKLGTISDNIANVNTVGYKESIANFSDLIASSLAASYSPGGVTSNIEKNNALQGELRNTTSPTDLAITGDGFFAVTDQNGAADGIFYTRAGSFVPNALGDYINSAGYILQGWALSNGVLPAGLGGASVAAGTAIPSLVPVNLNNVTGTPVGTSEVTLQANLQASSPAYVGTTVEVRANLDSGQAAYAGPPAYDPALASMASGQVAPQFTSPVTFVDSLGTSHTLQVGYLKTAADTWAIEVYAVPATDLINNASGQIMAGTATFNSDGSLSTISNTLMLPATLKWQDGAQDSQISFNWGTAGPLGVGQANGLSQFASASNVISLTQKIYDPTDPAASMASGAIPAQFNFPIDIVDANGNPQQITAGFLKTGVNTWAVEVYAPPANVTAANGQLAFGNLVFNGDGSLQSVSPALLQIPINWTNGAAASSIAFNWGTAGPIFGTPGATIVGRTDGMSQLDESFTLFRVDQNGHQAGLLSGVNITSDGFVAATFSNGVTQNLFKIPLAKFIAPDALQSLTGNVFATTLDSGNPTFSAPGQGGTGQLNANALESANVDLSSQLADMILAQRAYQANTKILSTTDTMLQDLDQMLG